MHACSWRTGGERGGVGGKEGEREGEGKGVGAPIPTGLGFQAPGWSGSPNRLGPEGQGLTMILLWIHSFCQSGIHSIIFFHSFIQRSATRTGTPKVSSRETRRETSRDTSRGTGATEGHQPGPETPAGTPDRFPLTLHNFGHRKWFPEFSGRGRGAGEDL